MTTDEKCPIERGGCGSRMTLRDDTFCTTCVKEMRNKIIEDDSQQLKMMLNKETLEQRVRRLMGEGR